MPRNFNHCPQEQKKSRNCWLGVGQLFHKCNPHLSIRKPENTNLAIDTGFNNNVTHIQNNDNNLLVTFKFKGKQIYNLDETGMTTVPSKLSYIQDT